MVCIYCKSETRVVNSRPQQRTNQVWRRRRCYKCRALFSTNEKLNLEHSIIVKSSSDKYEGFKKEKLLLSVYESLKHRRDVLEEALALTDTITSRLLNKLESPLLSTKIIKIHTHSVLKNFDKAASVHYKAFNPF